MNRKPLDEVLDRIGETYRDHIQIGSRFYLEVNIGKQAEALGYGDLSAKYRDACAVVPLKQAVPGMKVRIDGRTFVQYAQLASGVAVPGYVAKEAGLAHTTFVPNDSMILNCV